MPGRPFLITPICGIPVSRKTAWDIRTRDGSPLAIGAIADSWAYANGQAVRQLATATFAPSTDVKSSTSGRLCRPTRSEARSGSEYTRHRGCTLLGQFGEGLLSVRTAEGLDWNRP
jgi:hypothetical protein